MPNLISPQFSDVDLSFAIAKAVPIILRVPCPVPVQTSFGTMYDRPAVFLELEDDQGNKGLGEVWCNFPACGAEHRARLLETAIFPALLGVGFDSPDQCFAVLEKQFARLAIQAGEPGPVAQCIAGVDVALWDLVARRAGLPLFQLLGGNKATIPAYASGINPSNAAETVEKCRAEGHMAFKLKVGFDRPSDLDNIAKISAALKSNEQFMVDANQAWTVDEACDILPHLAKFSLGWLEEPIMADRPAEEWLTLALSASVPLAAGENMICAQDFDRGISRPILDVIQPDLCKWGGISGVLPVAQNIIAAGKRYCPHYLGGGIGLAASAHVLAAVGGDGMLEIDSNDNLLRNKLFAPLIAQGHLTLPDTPGHGVADHFAALLASGRRQSERQMSLPEYDYIIVGSGSAGSVVANRLSADPDCKVLVLEAGGQDHNFWLKLPVGYFKTIYDPRFSRVFDTEPSEGDGHRGIAWPRGRVVGGSSSINGLIYIRGQREDFEDWSDLGADGWSYEQILPHFRALERFKGGDDRFHGRDGDLPVSHLRNENAACQAWIAAAQQYGLPANPDFNGETTHGVGAYHLSIGKRLRASAAVAFLRPALKRKNLMLKTHALVSRVEMEGTRATGVTWTCNGKAHSAKAKREVILCAGALQSPQILQLSGIGPEAVLKEQGIPVVVDSPEVGENLQDHFQIRLLLKLNQKISLNDDVRNPIKLARMGLDWMLKSSGPLTVGAGQVGGGACTKYATPGRPDIQFNVMPLSVDKPGTPLHRYSGFTASFWQCHPESRGAVHIQSPDPSVQPRIAPNYLSAEKDRNVMVAGIRLLREIHAQPAFRPLWSTETIIGEDRQSDAQILDAVRNMGGTVFHPVGTCRMGRDSSAVLDPQLRVRGVEGLRVIDASVMPKITSANTNAATLMVGEKGAGMILNDAPLRNAKRAEERL